MVTHLSATRTCVLCFSLFLAAHCLPARTAELVGRVVDAVNAQTFAGALVQVRNSGQDARVGTTDGLGVFRMPGLMPGAYILDVKLPDGHDFVARVVLLPNRRTQFLELDHSRIVPPDDDAQY